MTSPHQTQMATARSQMRNCTSAIYTTSSRRKSKWIRIGCPWRFHPPARMLRTRVGRKHL